MALAFLNLGASELMLLLVLFLLLFGADKVPQLARSLGKAKGELERAQRQVKDAMRTEEERALHEQLAFERTREAHMAQQDVEMLALRRAAEELGVKPDGLTAEQLRAAIAEKVKGAPA